MRKIRAKIKKGIAVSTFLFALFFPWISSAYTDSAFSTATTFTVSNSIHSSRGYAFSYTPTTTVEITNYGIPLMRTALFTGDTISIEILENPIDGSSLGTQIFATTTTGNDSNIALGNCQTAYDEHSDFYQVNTGSQIVLQEGETYFFRTYVDSSNNFARMCYGAGSISPMNYYSDRTNPDFTDEGAKATYSLTLEPYIPEEEPTPTTNTIFLTSQVSTSTCTTEGTTSICTFEYGTLKEIGLLEYAAVILMSMSIVLFIFWIIRMFV